eukprot:TRINITY_DN4405_c0_g1_i1.p1 TRINITY_DN4405_c0_g1~~TRINITY_DN4405_c0_g1_i1.p1  ORF type:complete len:399 (+),score=109.17 TRINITY_DN4405_c0_g1_i1:80-1198(+)
MPRSQLQRLRCQLAASRGEVHALGQQIAQLDAASVAAAQERAATERLLLGRLADAAAHCREAEQRAVVAEIMLLQYAESEQRTGLLNHEDSTLGKVCDMFPAAVEVAGRAELAAAEEAAWAKLAEAQAANRKAVKCRRKSLRKKKQKERKRDQKRNRREPIPQDDESVGSEFTTAHSVTSSVSDSASSTPMSSSNVLFVDHICFWIAAFVPYCWAPVCSKAAHTVFRVMHMYMKCWKIVGLRAARFQSLGSHYVLDHEQLGPVWGLAYDAFLNVQELRRDVFLLMRSDPTAAPADWASRWTLHMDFRMNMYETIRLEHKELYLAARDVVSLHGRVVGRIGQALELFNQREQAEDDEVGAADESAVDNSDASV